MTDAPTAAGAPPESGFSTAQIAGMSVGIIVAFVVSITFVILLRKYFDRQWEAQTKDEDYKSEIDDQSRQKGDRDSHTSLVPPACVPRVRSTVTTPGVSPRRGVSFKEWDKGGAAGDCATRGVFAERRGAEDDPINNAPARNWTAPNLDDFKIGEGIDVTWTTSVQVPAGMSMREHLASTSPPRSGSPAAYAQPPGNTPPVSARPCSTKPGSPRPASSQVASPRQPSHCISTSPLPPLRAVGWYPGCDPGPGRRTARRASIQSRATTAAYSMHTASSYPSSHSPPQDSDWSPTVTALNVITRIKEAISRPAPPPSPEVSSPTKGRQKAAPSSNGGPAPHASHGGVVKPPAPYPAPAPGQIVWGDMRGVSPQIAARWPGGDASAEPWPTDAGYEFPAPAGAHARPHPPRAPTASPAEPQRTPPTLPQHAPPVPPALRPGAAAAGSPPRRAGADNRRGATAEAAQTPRGAGCPLRAAVRQHDAGADDAVSTPRRRDDGRLEDADQYRRGAMHVTKHNFYSSPFSSPKASQKERREWKRWGSRFGGRRDGSQAASPRSQQGSPRSARRRARDRSHTFSSPGCSSPATPSGAPPQRAALARARSWPPPDMALDGAAAPSPRLAGSPRARRSPGAAPLSPQRAGSRQNQYPPRERSVHLAGSTAAVQAPY